MGTILKNIVAFSELELDTPVSLPHRLNVNGIPAIPQLVGADAAGFTIEANETDVTVTRTATSVGDAVNIYVEHWHTIESVTPLVPPPGHLTGQVPFILASGGGGGAGPQIARGVFNADGSTINSVGCSTTHNGNGQYTVTFDPPFPDTCAPVATVAEDPGSTVVGIYVTNISGSSCDVITRALVDGFLLQDVSFSIVAVESVALAL
jgi:hypothetical protein